MAAARRRSRSDSRARGQRCGRRRAVHRARAAAESASVTSDPPIALKWTLYDPTLNALPLYEMNMASNWAEFSAALAQWCWPTQNLVYSDDQGHIAYHAIGTIPLRPAGLVDVPITDAAHEWQGYIPFDQMPNAFDPPSGFLATANSRVTTDKSPYPLTDDWADPYRIERIYKALDGRDKLTPADMLAVQTDIYSEVDQEMGHRFAYAIDHTPGPKATATGDAQGRRPDAQLGRPAHHRLRRRIARDPNPRRALADDSGAKAGQDGRRLPLGRIELCRGRDRDARQARVASEGLQELGRAADRGGAQRHEERQCASRSCPMDLRKLARGRHRASAGRAFCHSLAAWPEPGRSPQRRRHHREAGGPHSGPSQRFTMDWSNIDGSTENIVLGESGNPFSPYFRDQWNDWYNGTTFALPFTPAAVAAQTRTPCGCCHERTGNKGTREQGSKDLRIRRAWCFCAGPLDRSSRRLRRHRAAAHPRQLLRSRLRLSSRLLARLREHLASRHPLSALGVQPQLRRRRAALRLLSAAHLDAGRGARAGPALESRAHCAHVSYAGRNRPGHPRPGSRSARRSAGHARRMRGALLRIRALHCL